MKTAAVALFAITLLGAPRARAEKPVAMTALDDARACTPLSGGGYAVGTGGGLALLGRGARRTLTSLDGLPETRVHAVAENRDGIWVGTEAGAALVAGGVVVRTVGDQPVHALWAPPEGGAWIGTWGGGVYRLADKTAAPELVPTSASGRHVAAIAQHAGELHVAYSDGPVTRLEGRRLVEVAGSPKHGQSLASVSGRLLLGDVEGVFRLDGPRAPVSIASVDARAISGGLIATYGSGLLAAGSLRAEAGVPRWVRGVAVASSGSARCAATTEGLFVDEGHRWTKTPLGGPPSNDVTAIAVAPSGDRVAVGTFDRGAAIWEGGVFRAIRGLEHDETVGAIAWQGRRLWLGTAHGLIEIDETGALVRRLRAADGLPSSIVRSLLVGSGGELLVGTEEGAAIVGGGGGTGGARIRPIAASKKGARPGIDSPMHATWAIAEAGGIVYLGTSTGLYWGTRDGGSFARASVATGDLRDDWVTALAIVPGAGGVALGTYSGGVTRLAFPAGGGRPTATHLGGGYVNPAGLTVRGGALLAATMDGLLTRPLDRPEASWQRLDAASGRDVTAAQMVGSTLWVASRRGLVLSGS